MREFYRAIPRGLRLAGKVLLGMAALCAALMFAAPLYRKPTPGDEGGLSTLFFYFALGLLPIGAALLLLGHCLELGRGKRRAAVGILAGLAMFCAVRLWSGPDGAIPSLAVAVLASLIAAFGPAPSA